MAFLGEPSFVTIEDNEKNRYIKFIEFGITHFNLKTSTEMLCAQSKDNVKLSNSSNYLLEAATASLYEGLKQQSVLGPIGAAIGKTSGLILKDLLKLKKHKHAKKFEKIFAGYDPKSKDWIHLLAEVFHEIFVSYNMQVRYTSKKVN